MASHTSASQVTMMGSLEYLEFSSSGEGLSYSNPYYISCDSGQIEISEKVPGVSVNGYYEGECDKTTAESDSTKTNLSPHDVTLNFLREVTTPAQKTIWGTWNFCIVPNGPNPVAQFLFSLSRYVILTFFFASKPFKNQIARSCSNIHLGSH